MLYFAWVTAHGTFNAVDHARQDEDVFSCWISQQEAEAAEAVVEVKNPCLHQNIKNFSYDRHVFISTRLKTGEILFLFRGKLSKFW